VGPFADCSKFTPPKGTRVLCERTPPERRANPGAYVLTAGYSPGIKHFRGPFDGTSEDNRKVGAFARAAILGQPFDYLEKVGERCSSTWPPG